jgi:hypothetical protein
VKIKHLTKQGNSLAIIIDKKITLEPISEEEMEKRFTAAAEKMEKRFGRMFKNLAEK